jgi:hypothetical protein
MLARQLGMTARGPGESVAYWLMPAEPARSFFAAAIARLAARFDAPLFEPHVTIYAARSGDDIPAEVLRCVVANCNRLRLAVRDIQYSDEFTKTLFVRFESSPPLAKLSRTFQQVSALHAEYELNPHLSLLYRKMLLPEKTEAAASIRLPFTEVLFDSVNAVISPARVRSRQDVEAWRVAAVQRLAG